MPLPNYKEVIDLINQGSFVKTHESTMELLEATVGLREENFALRKKVRALEDEIGLKQHLRYEKGKYWLKNKEGKMDGPFCQRCYDVDKKLIRLQDYSKSLYCLECRNRYDRTA